MTSFSEKPRAKNTYRKPKIPTARSLTNVALYYLQRFATSEAGLRRVLENRIRRAAMANDDFAADKVAQENLKQIIASIVEQHKKTGVINDKAFAEMKVNSLRRGGGSARRISQKLQQKGLAKNVIAAALQPEDEEPQDVELQAALVFAKRRGLGKWRKKPPAEKQEQKDFAALMRAGFSFDVAKLVLGSAADIEEMDEI